MYVPEDFENYRYVVSYHDNYVVLTNRSFVNASWDNVQTIPTITQYIKPSTYTFDGFTSFTSSREFEEIEVNSSFYSRGDCPELLTCIIILILFICWILNAPTQFVKKGGIFFGS